MQYFSACAVAGGAGDASGYNCVFSPGVAAGSTTPEVCAEDTSTTLSTDDSGTSSSRGVPQYEVCVGDPQGFGLDVACAEGTALVTGAASVVKGKSSSHTAIIWLEPAVACAVLGLLIMVLLMMRDWL